MNLFRSDGNDSGDESDTSTVFHEEQLEPCPVDEPTPEGRNRTTNPLARDDPRIDQLSIFADGEYIHFVDKQKKVRRSALFAELQAVPHTRHRGQVTIHHQNPKSGKRANFGIVAKSVWEHVQSTHTHEKARASWLARKQRSMRSVAKPVVKSNDQSPSGGLSLDATPSPPTPRTIGTSVKSPNACHRHMSRAKASTPATQAAVSDSISSVGAGEVHKQTLPLLVRRASGRDVLHIGVVGGGNSNCSTTSTTSTTSTITSSNSTSSSTTSCNTNLDEIARDLLSTNKRTANNGSPIEERDDAAVPTVLLIDGAQYYQRMIASKLATVGCSVRSLTPEIESKDVQNGLVEWNSLNPISSIMINMPSCVNQGYSIESLVNTVRRLLKSPGLPIIVYGGPSLRDNDTVKRMMSSGTIDDVCDEPCTLPALKTLMENYHNRRAFRERAPLGDREMAIAHMRASRRRGKGGGGGGGGGERKRTGGSMSSWFFEQISASKD